MQRNRNSSKLRKLLRTVDGFSMPFQFALEDTDCKHKTVLGGFITLVVYIISLFYLLYLSNLYFSSGIQPKVSVTDMSSQGESYQLQENALAFNFFIRGFGSIQDYEKKKGKGYLNFIVNYSYFNKEGEYKVQRIKSMPCKDSSISKYLCIDFSSIPMEVNLRYNQTSSSYAQEGFQILFVKCFGPNCATDEEINDVVFDVTNRWEFSTQLIRYNSLTYKQEILRKIDSYSIDDNIAMRHQFWLVKSRTILIEGLIFQSATTKDYLDSIEEIQEVRTTKTLQKQAKIPLVGSMMVNLSQKHKVITIQYPLYTEILAQFTSILTLLLLIGKIGKNYSEIEIYQELTNIYIKKYYKQTAANIMQKIISKKQINEKNKEEKNEDFELMKMKKQEVKQNQINKQGQDASEIIKMSEKINDVFFPSLLQKETKISIFKKILIILLRRIPEKFINKKQEFQEVIYNMVKSTHKSVNIVEFYKEIVQIKLMIRLLFSKEQYSAIKFCGIDIEKSNHYLNHTLATEYQKNSNLIDQQLSQKSNNYQIILEEQHQAQQVFKKISVNNNLQKTTESSPNLVKCELNIGSTNKIPHEISDKIENQINHLEEIEEIDQNVNLTNYYFKRFLQNIQEKQQHDILDNRIMNCLIQIKSENDLIQYYHKK